MFIKIFTLSTFILVLSLSGCSVANNIRDIQKDQQLVRVTCNTTAYKVVVFGVVCYK